MNCPEEVYNYEILEKLKEKGIKPFWSDDDELVLEVSGALDERRISAASWRDFVQNSVHDSNMDTDRDHSEPCTVDSQKFDP
eukprot:12076099-Alexandrium_andersonii.AAC.1